MRKKGIEQKNPKGSKLLSHGLHMPESSSQACPSDQSPWHFPGICGTDIQFHSRGHLSHAAKITGASLAAPSRECTPPLWASGLSLDFGFRSGAGEKSGAVLQGILSSISPAPCRVPNKPWNCEVRAAWEGVLPGALWGLWLCSNLPFLLHAGLKPQAVRWGQGTSLQQPVKALGSPSPAGRERGASAWGKPDQKKRLKAKRLNSEQMSEGALGREGLFFHGEWIRDVSTISYSLLRGSKGPLACSVIVFLCRGQRG